MLLRKTRSVFECVVTYKKTRDETPDPFRESVLLALTLPAGLDWLRQEVARLLASEAEYVVDASVYYLGGSEDGELAEDLAREELELSLKGTKKKSLGRKMKPRKYDPDE